MDLPAQMNHDPWPSVQSRLREAVGATTFDVWLSSLRLRAWDGSVLELEAPQATAAWVSRRYGRLLDDCARQSLGEHVEVRLVPAAARRPRQASAGASATATGENGAGLPPGEPPPDVFSRQLRLNPRYSFDQFIIGEGNRLAHAAALSVAELPGQAYNPLFLYAPPGLGKTHLLHAIGNYLTSFGGGATVRYATVEAFTNHFLRALGSRSVDSFKAEYRAADVLLIDDVQFLASKARTEEEFFHTFNAVYENGRQLVITCDRIPSRLVGIEQRLRERFDAGLVAEIKPPDHSTRVAILRKRAALDGIAISDPQVLELIASRVTDNIRALEGALIRVVAFNSLTGRPIDTELTTTVLDSIAPVEEGGRAHTADSITQAVCEYFSVSSEEIRSAGRAARISWPRQVAIYLTREFTDLSLPAIGRAFARNHATVLHSCRRVENRIQTDRAAREDVDTLRRDIRHQQDDRSD